MPTTRCNNASGMTNQFVCRQAGLIKDSPGARGCIELCYRDAWTSPHHKAYVAVTIHFEQEGKPVSMLLDKVQLAELYSGLTLVVAFAQIFENFGIADKVLPGLQWELLEVTHLQLAPVIM